jgi:predicted oxidoreductase
MNELSGDHLLDYNSIRQLIEERDRELDNKFSKDTQINYIRSTRKYLGDKLGRVAKPHKILAPENGPLIAVRLNILTRKTLGGIETNLNAGIQSDGEVLKGFMHRRSCWIWRRRNAWIQSFGRYFPWRLYILRNESRKIY